MIAKIRRFLIILLCCCAVMFEGVSAAVPFSYSSDADLVGIDLSCGTLRPVFSANTTSYTVFTGNDTVDVGITPWAEDPSAVITVNSRQCSSGFHAIVSLTDTRYINITVTSASGDCKSYVINFIAPAAKKAGLTGLFLNGTTLSPAFSSDTVFYSADVDYGTDSVTVVPSADSSEIVSVNNSVVQSGSGYRLPLIVGTNTAVINVSIGFDCKTYTIAITRRAAQTSCGLSGLAVSSGSLSPAFCTGTLSYSLNVQNKISSLTVTPQAAESADAIYVNNTPVQSGAGYTIPLSVGTNTAVITVLNAYGSKTYYLSVTRAAPSASAQLLNLSISAGSLSPSFSSGIYSYTASVDNSVSRLYFSATAADFSDSVKINGSQSGSVELYVGNNVITVTVTTKDSAASYTIEVFRGYGTQITSSSQNADGAYYAAVPDYVSQLGGQTLAFSLGSDKILLTSSALAGYKNYGSLILSCGDAAQSTLQKVRSIASDNCTVAGGKDILLTGGAAQNGCTLGAAVTLSLTSGEKSVIKSGVPLIYYYDSQNGTLEDAGAVFDLSAGTAKFTAQKTGTYIIAATLYKPNIKYTVAADSNYTVSKDAVGFKVSVIRGSDSQRLSDASLLIVTTNKSGKQQFVSKPLSGDSDALNIEVGKDSAQSEVYLICGKFDGKSIPKTYAFVQTIKAK